MNQLNDIPQTDVRNEDDLPWVTLFEGVDFKALHTDIDKGLWVIDTRLAPGITLPTHKHTGEVFAVTSAGSWHYLEQKTPNNAGAYLYEPAGSVHTLHVPDTNTGPTRVWFAVHGANLNLDESGNIDSVWDAQFIRDTYFQLCADAGLERPNII